jgi:hypothetical protein
LDLARPCAAVGCGHRHCEGVVVVMGDTRESLVWFTIYTVGRGWHPALYLIPEETFYEVNGPYFETEVDCLNFISDYLTPKGLI